MSLTFIKNDITTIECDAIVNAANKTLLGGGGVDGAIHRAAGIKLLEECRTLNGCETGEAKITNGYNLPAKYVIHTVGPIWEDGKHNEKQLLENCYINCMNIAKDKNLHSIAFPIISSGVYGYPKKEALKVAVNTISNYLSTNQLDINVYIVVFSSIISYIGSQLYADINSFIDDKYTDGEDANYSCSSVINEEICKQHQVCSSSVENSNFDNEFDELNKAIDSIDESFSQMVLRLIDNKNMTDVECYKKANIDRKLFSKLRSNISYSPSKRTAIAIGIALELNKNQMNELLNKAGYSLSNCNKFDIIIKYFIERKIYDVYEINEILFAFDQQLLGC